MQRYLIKFFFHNSTHFGSDLLGVGEEASKMMLHSDTLFSALCNVWAQIDWQLKADGFRSFKEVLEDFQNGPPPFKLSSGFPFRGTKFFLPKPAQDSKILYRSDLERSEFSKKVKKLRFLELDAFAAWLNEDANQEGLASEIARDKYNDFGREQVLPKTPVDRFDHGSNIYHSSCFYFRPVDVKSESGLYAIVELNHSLPASQFELVLQHLTKFGLGGNRNVGQGAINTIKFEKLPSELERLFSLQSKMGYCLLSLYFPRNTINLRQHVNSYNLVLRKGWIGTHSVNKSLKRKNCFMFSEGSLFNNLDDGVLVNVRPDAFTEHGVWQYGYALTMPAKPEEG